MRRRCPPTGRPGLARAVPPRPPWWWRAAGVCGRAKERRAAGPMQGGGSRRRRRGRRSVLLRGAQEVAASAGASQQARARSWPTRANTADRAESAGTSRTDTSTSTGEAQPQRQTARKKSGGRRALRPRAPPIPRHSRSARRARGRRGRQEPVRHRRGSRALPRGAPRGSRSQVATWSAPLPGARLGGEGRTQRGDSSGRDAREAESGGLVGRNGFHEAGGAQGPHEERSGPARAGSEEAESADHAEVMALHIRSRIVAEARVCHHMMTMLQSRSRRPPTRGDWHRCRRPKRSCSEASVPGERASTSPARTSSSRGGGAAVQRLPLADLGVGQPYRVGSPAQEEAYGEQVRQQGLGEVGEELRRAAGPPRSRDRGLPSAPVRTPRRPGRGPWRRVRSARTAARPP